LAAIETPQRRQRIARPASDSDLVREHAQRVSYRMVDPGPAHIDRRATKINGVQSPADPGASLDDYALDPALRQCVGNG
jgi:hypothetical protein